MLPLRAALTGTVTDGAGCLRADDFGDAPDSYSTKIDSRGPHNPPLAGLTLGPASTIEGNARPNAAKVLDGTGDTDDALPSGAPGLTAGETTYKVENIPVKVPAGKSATLRGWADFNGNGTFEANEASAPVTRDSNDAVTLQWTGAPAAKKGANGNYLRLRLEEGTTPPNPDDPLVVNGLSRGIPGETEDYPVRVDSPALKVTVTADPAGDQPPGGAFTAKLTVTNKGPGRAVQPTTVTIPLGTGFLPGTGLPAGCAHDAAARAIVCRITDALNAGAVKNLEVPLKLAQSVTLASTQTATVTVANPGEAAPTADNTAVLTKAVSATAVSTWRVTATPVPSDTVRPASIAQVDVRVVNEGPSDAARTAPLTVTVPPGTTVDTTLPMPAGCRATDTTTVLCDPDVPLAAGAAKEFRIWVKTPNQRNGTFPGGAAKAGTGTAAFTLKTGPLALPNITLRVVPPDPVGPGERKPMGIEVRNAGPGDAEEDVTVTVTVPSGTSVDDPGCQVSGRILTCVLPKSQLTEGNARILNPIVTAAPDAVLGSTNTGGKVVVTYPGGDLDAGDNTVGFNVTVANTAVTVPNVTINQGEVVAPGETTTAVITVTNNGPAVARPPTKVVIDLPPHTTLVTTPAGCVLGQRTLTCEVGTVLPVGGTAVFPLPLKVDPDTPLGADLPGKVVVTGTGVDPVGGNNMVEFFIRLATKAKSDLQLTGVNPAGDTAPGGEAAVTLTVKNAGPSATATDSTVTLPLPPGTTAAAYPAGCVPSATQLVCTVGPLAVGAEVALPVTLLLSPEVPLGQPLSSESVLVGTDVIDPVADNNKFTVTVPVAARALSDLWVQVPPPAKVAPGAVVEVRVSVTNLGPSMTAEKAKLTVTLPDKVTAVDGAMPPGCGISDGGKTVTCDVDKDAVRQGGATFILMVKIDADVAPNSRLVGGTAEVGFTTTPGNDPNPSNDRAEFFLETGAAESDLGVTVAGRPRMFRTPAR
jgi:hypothetical protein